MEKLESQIASIATEVAELKVSVHELRKNQLSMSEALNQVIGKLNGLNHRGLSLGNGIAVAGLSLTFGAIIIAFLLR